MAAPGRWKRWAPPPGTSSAVAPLRQITYGLRPQKLCSITAWEQGACRLFRRELWGGPGDDRQTVLSALDAADHSTAANSDPDSAHGQARPARRQAMLDQDKDGRVRLRSDRGKRFRSLKRSGRARLRSVSKLSSSCGNLERSSAHSA